MGQCFSLPYSVYQVFRIYIILLSLTDSFAVQNYSVLHTFPYTGYECSFDNILTSDAREFIQNPSNSFNGPGPVYSQGNG